MRAEDQETLDSLRFTFQRILTPLVVIIGCAGNAISVVVLTRRRMRCSTNVYLTALAIVDIIFLLFVLLLSLQHHPTLRQPKYSIYWNLYGLSHWICDAVAYTSIWLTVSFTIERYIAVCHPIRGQVLCTESRAKKVIALCVVLCFLLTVSTAFEYKVDKEPKYYNSLNQICTPNTTEIPNIMTNNTEYAVSQEDGNETSADEFKVNINGVWCEKRTYLGIASSDFGKNENYKNIFYVLTTILFVFGPLILLATFNCYLIAAVHRSHRLRKTMTNNSHGSGGDSSQQENKITIILIAVCVLFFICQSPTAIVLLYTIIAKADEDSFEMLAVGNVVNFLITINAACNFILYCVLSDKYRHTVRSLLCGKTQKQEFRESQMSRFTSFRTSEYKSNSSPSATKRQSINERKQLINNSDPPFVVTLASDGGATNGGDKRLKTTHFSPKTIDEGHDELKSRRSSNKKKRSKVIRVIEPDNTSYMRSPTTKCTGNMTPAVNLRRCVSLNSRPSPKHSPHCQQNPFKF